MSIHWGGFMPATGKGIGAGLMAGVVITVLLIVLFIIFGRFVL
jgi:hypothetical protein